MDTEPTINTQGGSVIHGDLIVSKGDFVGRDKITNVFGLTRQQTFLLVSILAGVIITIWLILTPPELPVPLTGDFTIGIAAMGQSDNTQAVVESKAGRAWGDEIYHQLDSAIQQANLDFRISLGDPKQIGAITGEGFDRIKQARERAEVLNVDLLIFGTLTLGEESSSFVPELYISPDVFPRAEEAADHFALEPIPIAGKILNNPASKKELRSKLIDRVEEYLYFSIGLGYLERDNVELAADYFGRAYKLAYKLQTTRDRTALLLMLGIVANRQSDPQAAYTYYNEAAIIDPDYARAVLGKGQTLSLMVSKHCTKEEIDQDRIDAALALYVEAENLTPLPYAEIPSKVALFRAQAYTCLAEADGNAKDWHDAQINYERVLRNYAANPSPLLRYVAAEASGGLALVILREDVWNLPTVPAATLADALAAFKQAAEWSKRPDRSADFLLWQVALYVAHGDCTNAQSSFVQATTARQSYIQKNPTQSNNGLEEFLSRVAADLHTCDERKSS